MSHRQGRQRAGRVEGSTSPGPMSFPPLLLWGALLVPSLVAAAAFAAWRVGSLEPLDRPDPSLASVRGIDVSHHQGAIDWAAVRASGVEFAFIKSSEGRDFSDPRFARNWRESGQAGLARGAYHFFTFCSPGDAQASHFLATLPPQPDVLVPVADVEFVGNCTGWSSLESIRTQLAKFLTALEKAWGRPPILYLTPDSHARIVDGHFDAHPIWIRGVLRQPAPGDYGGWLLWQYSDTGRVPGIRGNVDLDVLRPGARLAELRVSPRANP